MSPEQTGLTSAVVDHRTDVYSFGICSYQLVTGVLPFKRTKGMKDELELARTIVSTVPQTPSHVKADLPPIIDQIIMKCISKNPEDRYQTMHSLVVDLMTARQILASSDTNQTFELSLYDKLSVFQPSRQLYGRGHAFQTLKEAFHRMQQTGRVEVVSVRGLAGSGKTSLIQQYCREITSQHSVLYVKSKLEEYQRQPFACIKQVAQQLLLNVCALNPTELTQWRAQVLELCKGNGQLLTSLFPMLHQLLGAQPNVSMLPSQEAASRLRHLLSSFLCTFASRSRPLVIFFDDIQWADRFSLEAIETLAKNPMCMHTLILLSARSQGDRFVALNSTLNRMAESKVSLHRIMLTPLSNTSVNHFVSDTLHCSPLKSLALSTFICKESKGSPLFVHQMILRLHRDGLITFQLEYGRPTPHAMPAIGQSSGSSTQAASSLHGFKAEWRYSMPQVLAHFQHLMSKEPEEPVLLKAPDHPSSEVESEDAIDDLEANLDGDSHMVTFLQRYINQLSPTSRQVLFTASCIGIEFSVSLLSKLLRPTLTGRQIRAALQQPLDEELIVLEDKNEPPIPQFVGQEPDMSGGEVKSAEEHKADAVSPASAPIEVPEPAASPAEAEFNMTTADQTLVDEAQWRQYVLVEQMRMRAKKSPAIQEEEVEQDAPGQLTEDENATWMNQTFLFAHDKILESTYSMLAPDARAELHQRIAGQILIGHHHEINGLLASALRSAALPHYAVPPELQLEQTRKALIASQRTADFFFPVDASEKPPTPPLVSPPSSSAGPPISGRGSQSSHRKTLLTDSEIFTVANHFIRCIHVVAACEVARRSAATLLLIAALKAKASASYTTALYFMKVNSVATVLVVP
jgi:hypothetical protein